MKWFKKVIIMVIIIVILIGIYAQFIYKDEQYIENLIKKSDIYKNVFAEYYIDFGRYMDNGIREYKYNIYIKDSMHIYDILDEVTYMNFETNEGYNIKDGEKTNQFLLNEFHQYNSVKKNIKYGIEGYIYLFPCYVQNTWCELFILLRENGYEIVYIDKNTGFLIKEIDKFKNSDGSKITETKKIEYKFEQVTDEILLNLY